MNKELQPTIVNLTEIEKLYYYLDQIKKSGTLQPNQTWYILRIEHFIDQLHEEITNKYLKPKN